MQQPHHFAPVHGIQHLDGDQHGESHGHRMGIVEDLAVQSLELVSAAQARQVMRELPVSHLRALRRVQEPPGGGTNGRSTDISSNGHVTEEWRNSG